jgi:low temperature requirement protein LtrA
MRIGVSRAPGAERVVTPLELLFDLVYVFAIGQLSHHLVEHVDLRTGAETVIMALAVVHAWYMTAWGANWLEPDRLPVRVLLVGLMFASLLMSVAIGDAFDGRAWLFVTGYLLLQVGRAAFLIVALRGRALGEHFVNDLVWELVIGALWVAGAIADGDARLALWGLAVVAAQGGAWALHWLPGRGQRVDLEHTEIAGAHLNRALPAVLPHRPGRDRGDDGHRLYRRAVRARAPARAGDRLHGDGRAVVVLLPARGSRRLKPSRRRSTPARSAGGARGR